MEISPAVTVERVLVGVSVVAMVLELGVSLAKVAVVCGMVGRRFDVAREFFSRSSQLRYYLDPNVQRHYDDAGGDDDNHVKLRQILLAFHRPLFCVNLGTIAIQCVLARSYHLLQGADIPVSEGL
jgi:hypothetical protein